jgi:hypothetical protein
MGLPVLLEEICRLILGIYKSLKDTSMWKLGLRPAELFPEKEYINGIAVAVCASAKFSTKSHGNR